jgi:type II secretory pathway component PulM
MVNLDSIKDYIQGLSYKEVTRILYGYIILFMIVVGFLLYRHFNAISDAEKKMKLLNKGRQDIQIILTEYAHIKNKKNEVDLLLGKDKNFYIQKYYQDALTESNITNQSSSNLVSQTWPNGYIEESVQINLSQITMKQLCEFLQILQKNPRVFLKNLDILKGSVDKKINVNMSIATLKTEQIIEKTSSTK